MPSTKLLKVLLFIAGTLAFVLVAIFLLRRPRRTIAPFAEAVDIAQKITIQKADTDVELVRDSATWTVSRSTTGPYAADSHKVSTLQGSLHGIHVEDVISESGNNASDFDLNPESATTVLVYGKGSSLLARGVFGKPAENSMTQLYFRYPDKPAIYLAHGILGAELGDGTVNWWRDRNLLNLAEEQVLTLFIEGPGFKTALARSSDTWTCNGKLVDPVPVWGMLGVLAHLKAEAFADLSADQLTYASASIQLKDGSTHVLHIGKHDAKTKLYPVAFDKDPHSAWVAERTLQAILQKPSSFKPPARLPPQPSAGEPAPAKMDSR